MIRRPPRSTLFPYTPLSRSQRGQSDSRLLERLPPRRVGGRSIVDQPRRGLEQHGLQVAGQKRSVAEQPDQERGAPLRRSEEHTSELQSRQYLVCRLLLEKKK